MLKMNNLFTELEEYIEQLESLSRGFYETNFRQQELEELRDLLTALSEKFSSEKIDRTLCLTEADTYIERLLTMKEVDLSDYEENGVLDPDQFDVGAFITEKTNEKYEMLMDEARADLKELTTLLKDICSY